MVQAIHAKALFDCVGDEESELTFHEGDLLIDVRETSEEGWLHGRLERTGEEGLFPDNYVELIHVQPTSAPPKVNGPPQLPVRSSIGTKNSSSIPATSLQPEAASGQSNNTTSIKPLLPARKGQASPVTTTGLRKVETSIIPGGVEKAGATAAATASSKVALPGLGSRSMYGATKPDTSDPGRALSGPPALPRRSNTVYENVGSATEQSSASGPAFSVRERMANLSMANQRQTSSPSASISALQPAVKEIGQRGNIGAAVRSPNSSALRPALPPRTLTDSPAESPPPPTPSTSAGAAKHVYQVQDAAVPVPKLTTFSRPRSARTVKSSGSLELASPASSSPQPAAASTPPKLPSRPLSVAPTTPSVIKPVDSGPIRFSPAAVRQGPTGISALPTISRNSQPLPLPSRNNLNSSTPSSLTANTYAGLSKSTTTTIEGLRHAGFSQEKDNNASETSDIPAGAAFGVKLNSVGSRTPKDTRTVSSLSAPPTATSSVVEAANDTAPPLPARPSTNPSTPSTTPSERATTPSMTLQRETASRQFSPSPSPGSAQANRSKSQVYEPQAGDMARRWGSTLSSPARASSGSRVAMLPPRLPDVAAPGSVGVKANARRRYEVLFKSVCSGDYIEGVKVHTIYVRSRLDSKTLAQIWDLVDVDNAGRLSKAQFCMGLYLIDERLASGLIPLEVSDELWVSVMQ
ncbi:hypothetical protein EDD21DRAFT_384854 [Dissophora ornata]|nr:hypothetical protein EDD21DRAFT_384854 [Dissophora ornata]